MIDPPPQTPSRLERVLDRESLIVAAGLLVVVTIAWAWIVPMAIDMYGAMTGPSAWMMTNRWDFTHVSALFAMWAVMMVAMMLPSAAPTVLLYTHVVRKSRDDSAQAVPRAYVFVGGYLVVWTLFAAAATVLQRALSEGLFLSPMMESQHRWLSAGVLLAAGAYQLTTYKAACLAWCRSPAVFLATAWKRGAWGAWQMGVRHGLICLGCCWLLMLLLFVGGVMNLVLITFLTVLVLAEKLLPFGRVTSVATGVICLGAGVLVAAAWI